MFLEKTCLQKVQTELVKGVLNEYTPYTFNEFNFNWLNGFKARIHMTIPK